jgi:cob(I)alamin adenosyltransferase
MKRKIYTRMGDEGITSFGDSKKIAKSSELIEFVGMLDELNCFLGYAAEALGREAELALFLPKLQQKQGELFEAGLFLAQDQRSTFGMVNIAKLEEEMDLLAQKLPVIKDFVLPGGGEISVRLHLARAICRRGERTAFRAMKASKGSALIAVYLNRLGDWLYLLARYAAFVTNIEELCWRTS